jgi:2-methylcitrate dehydratase PrpD
MPDTAAAISAHAAEVRFEDLPDVVVEKTMMSILDTLGVMVAGSTTDTMEAVKKVVFRWGGREESTVVGQPQKVPAYGAVLANAAMAHQFDFDDTHDKAVCHPTSASLSAALAAAEAVGEVSGCELITAVAVGNDLVCRLGLAIEGTLWDYPWVRAPVIGIFGAALAAGRIMRLNAAQLHNALGLSLPQTAGTLQCLRDEGSAVRGMRDGLIYKDAMLAVSLAAADVRGEEGVFDGEYGLYRSYFRGEYSPDVLTDKLGEHYEGVNVSLKPWPTCRHTHGTLTALMEIVRDPGFDVDHVDEVVVHVGDGNQRICDPIDPAEFGPEHRMRLLCNIPFAVAVAVARGGMPLAAFLGESLDADIVAMLGKVRTVYDPEQNRTGTIEPGHVSVRFRGGETRTSRADLALGHPSFPLSWTELEAKIEDCVGVAWGVDSSASADSLSRTVRALEEMPDVAVVAHATIPAH